MSAHGELAVWKRSSAGLEIDLVLPDGPRSTPLECKAAREVKRTHLRGLFGYLDFYGLQTGALVSFAPLQDFDGPDGRMVISVPLYLAEYLTSLVGQ